jgi:hypothetical protein
MALYLPGYLSGDIHEGILYIYICCFDIVYYSIEVLKQYEFINLYMVIYLQLS